MFFLVQEYNLRAAEYSTKRRWALMLTTLLSIAKMEVFSCLRSWAWCDLRGTEYSTNLAQTAQMEGGFKVNAKTGRG